MKRLSYRRKAEKEAADAAALAARFDPLETKAAANLAGHRLMLDDQRRRADKAWEAFANATPTESDAFLEMAWKEESHLQKFRQDLEEELDPGGGSWPSKRFRRALELEADRRGYTLANLEREESALREAIFDIRRRRH